MTDKSTIRGLERGLRVLQALQMKPDLTLQDIHIMTTISKPSLLRVLATLERFGLVTRRLADGRYRISTVTANIARKPDRYDRVAELAAPILRRLCHRVSWPSELIVPAGGHLEVRESSRAETPFPIMNFGIYHRVSWLMSAVGRAYLAYCPLKDRQRILKLLQKSQLPEDRLAHDPDQLDNILAETRARGYAIRDPSFVGGPYGGPTTSDGLAAIAVPLRGEAVLHGVINMTWLKPAYRIEDFAALHLDDLKGAAAEIVHALEANSPKSSLRKYKPQANAR
jgi:IclR family transcriptional regulator, mhp operon transcriptional activator